MTETESNKDFFSKGHENLYIYKLDRSLESFSFHLNRYLESLESRSRFSRFKEQYLSPIIFFFKSIWRKRKIMKKNINKLRTKLKTRKYKNCFLIFQAKGLTFEEILQEILIS